MGSRHQILLHSVENKESWILLISYSKSSRNPLLLSNTLLSGLRRGKSDRFRPHFLKLEKNDGCELKSGSRLVEVLKNLNKLQQRTRLVLVFVNMIARHSLMLEIAKMYFT